MILQQIIKNIENSKYTFLINEIPERRAYNDGIEYALNIVQSNLLDLEKSNELQEEMAKALVADIIKKHDCYYDRWICKECGLSNKCVCEKRIKLVEKYYGKPWEDIIK